MHFGHSSIDIIPCGTGSADIDATDAPTLKEALESRNLEVNETLWNFYEDNRDNYQTNPKKGDQGIRTGDGTVQGVYTVNEIPWSAYSSEAKSSISDYNDAAIVVISRIGGEMFDIPSSLDDPQENDDGNMLSLTYNEQELLRQVSSQFSKTIVLINSTNAMEMDFMDQAEYGVDAALWIGYTGVQGLYGVADLLVGNSNPSGRLVDTYCIDNTTAPSMVNMYGDTWTNASDYTDLDFQQLDGNLYYNVYQEGIYVGYRYYETRYEDVVLGQGNAGDYDYASEVCYPLGYGLSYTTFSWSAPQITWKDGSATATVEVTNTGSVAGKDVVELYAQSPYTDYDKENGVEKPSVELLAYAKTSVLEPGASEIVTMTFDEEQFKAYDANGAKTYILDAGTYYITAAKDAHEAINNILTAKGKTTADGMTAAGDAAMVTTYEPKNADTDLATYAKDTYSGAEITNQLDDAKGDVAYLTRNDWMGTFPTHDGEPTDEISTWGNEINGSDKDGNPASYVYSKTIDADGLKALDSFDSGSPVDASKFDDEIVYGKKNDLTLIQMRGLDFDDPQWEDLLDELTYEDYYNTIALSGYGIEYIDSIDMPFCTDADTANGLIYGGTGKYYPNSMTLAQTWNQDLAKEMGTMIGNEAIIGGMDGWYAPSMNIHRTPFSGRNGEYYSEDPYLSGAVASNQVYGAATKGVYAYIKHFAFNDQEDHRGDCDGQYGLATWLNEQSAREIYLKPFEMCMKLGDVTLNYLEQKSDGTYENATRQIRACQAVMTAFNRIGYTWTGGSYNLLTGIARNEWAFNGMMITDNANTGVFMDGYQMIEAGGDIKLTYLADSARFDFDKNDTATYHYAREAMHRVLYTVANSKAMLGAMPGTDFVDEPSDTEKITMAVDIVCGILIALLAVTTVLRFVPRKKKQK